MPKNLQNPTMLFEFIIKNAKIMFVYYLFRKLKCYKLHEDLTKQQDSCTDPKTFRNSKSHTFSTVVASHRSEYFTVKCVTKKLICSCLSWSWREDLSADLMPKIPKLNHLSCPNKYDRTGGHNYYPGGNSNQNSIKILCNLRTKILTEPFIQPHKQIYDLSQLWADLI